jgi:hypothetical protein
MSEKTPRLKDPFPTLRRSCRTRTSVRHSAYCFVVLGDNSTVHAKLASPNCLLTSSEQNSTLLLQRRKYSSLAPWNETRLKTCQLGCFRRQGLAVHCKCEISSIQLGFCFTVFGLSSLFGSQCRHGNGILVTVLDGSILYYLEISPIYGQVTRAYFQGVRNRFRHRNIQGYQASTEFDVFLICSICLLAVC